MILRVLAFAAVMGLAGCGGGPEPTIVNTLRGTYRGVGIGATTRSVERVFGHRPLSGQNEPISPRKEDFVDIGGPTVIAGACGTTLRYDHVTFLVCDGRVTGFIVAQSGARTERGVAIGDNADKAASRYPELTCGQAPFEGGSYPYCGGRIAAHRWVWFGRDPVRSITVTTAPLRS